MTQSQKRLLANLGLGMGVLIGLILSMFMFIQPRDLKNYTRLTDGAGKTVQATSEGGVGVTMSSRRIASSVRYCTSWRYEVDGNERHFTDKKDCHNNKEDAKSGTSAELIYDPADLGIVFVHSDATLNNLKSGQSGLRIASIIGVVLLVGSIVGLVVVNRSKKSA
jgi:hypothetical protein